MYFGFVCLSVGRAVCLSIKGEENENAFQSKKDCSLPNSIYFCVSSDGKIGGETIGVRSEKLPQGQPHRQRSR